MRKESDAEVIGGEEVPRELEWAREMGAQSADIETLKTEVQTLRAEMSELRKDTAAIREMLASNKGGVRMLLAVGSIAASLGAGIAEVIHWWHR